MKNSQINLLIELLKKIDLSNVELDKSFHILDIQEGLEKQQDRVQKVVKSKNLMLDEIESDYYNMMTSLESKPMSMDQRVEEVTKLEESFIKKLKEAKDKRSFEAMVDTINKKLKGYGEVLDKDLPASFKIKKIELDKDALRAIKSLEDFKLLSLVIERPKKKKEVEEPKEDKE